MKSECPPKREPCAKMTPCASEVMFTSAMILYDRPRMLTATLSGTGDVSAIVDVTSARRLGERVLDAEQLDRRSIVEGQHEISIGFLAPRRDELLELLRLFRRDDSSIRIDRRRRDTAPTGPDRSGRRR